MIKVRVGKESDVTQLVDLDKLAGKEIKWWQPLSKLEFLKILKHKKLLYVAEEKGEIIGYLSGTIKGKKLILENVFVKKEFRKKGVATELIKKFSSDWENKDMKETRLHCPERLKEFYEKLGFRITALVMKKEF